MRNTSRDHAPDQKQCPKCGYRFSGANSCPRCGYNGYFPLTDERIKRIKWILYPILLALAVAVYLWVRHNGA